MRGLANVVRTVKEDRQTECRGERESQRDHLLAWAASAEENPRNLLDKLLDGQEPTEQYFGEARPS